MPKHANLFVLAAIVLTGLAWVVLRDTLESGLASAAQRDLATIVDLVSADVEGAAESPPPLKGIALARRASGSGTLLARALRQANDERFRNVYFFDATGQVVGADKLPQDSAPGSSPGIVRRAIETRHLADAPERGSLSDPYLDFQGEEVIGAWRWLPRLELGIVAERPYERFAQPLDWVDGIFAAILAALVAMAFAIGMPGAAELLAAFRRPDIRRCGPYRIERLIGEGAMSNVYLARHQHLGRIVALKRLKVRAQSDELSERFDREARFASRLSHPNIVTILDHGRVPEGGFFYAMEFVHGLTLTQWVQQFGPLPPARAVRILRQICAAVGAMHHAGFLHRDIKPDNVMAYAANGDFDLVKLLDFGLIKNLEGDESRDLTRNVQALGTPAYMAPERLSDPRSIDPRTDLYGIGCIAFFLLTGRKPFEATLDADLAQQILHVAAPPVSGLSPFPIPVGLEALIEATLAKDMDCRPQSAEALDSELAEVAGLAVWRPELARLWWQSAVPAQQDR